MPLKSDSGVEHASGARADADVVTESPALLEIDDLRVEIAQGDRTVRPLDGVTLSVRPREALGLVGESGCGKTMTALAVMGLLPNGGRISSGAIRLDGRDLAQVGTRGMRQVRGREVGFVSQDPLSALNPTYTIGYQVAEGLRIHEAISRSAARERAEEMLELVGLPQAKERMAQYPHELSGGMRQRVAIAMALICRPKLLVADEPTTALDVTIQRQILELLDRLREQLHMALILITHDLGVIAGHADRVAVMYGGKVVESAPTTQLYAQPRHRYTQDLFAALPQVETDRRKRLFSIPGMPPDLVQLPVGCQYAARCMHAEEDCRIAQPEWRAATGSHGFACLHPCGAGSEAEGAAPEVREGHPAPLGQCGPPASGTAVLRIDRVVKDFGARGRLLRRTRGQTVSAVDDVSFSVDRGEVFGLVGESGCGKTTLGRMAVGLETPTSGEILVSGVTAAGVHGRDLRQRRRTVQMVFQDSYESLDPRMTIAATLTEPLVIHAVSDRKSREARVRRALDRVGLPASALERYPHEFSGGQRQRIGLARAIVLEPELIVADEPVSALDVSIQAQILNLLLDLQAELGLSYLFVSHDLAVVRHMASRIAVMYLGQLVEIGSRDDIYRRAAHPYTAGLLESMPVPDPAAERAKRSFVAGELPSAINPPSGCRFRTRCPLAQDVCAQVRPPLRRFSDGHEAACHFPLQDPLPVAPAR